jgi:CubicO group peptidase (beta-lactamase class C family)
MTGVMLYLEPDMAGFAASQPALFPPGRRFSYSTGTPMLLARLWMDRVGDEQTALAYPQQALFGPLGMTSAVLETDETGTFAIGSYMYATGRDWARLGLFLAQDGVWNGARILPEGFVKMMMTGNGGPGGYSQMLTWLDGPTESAEQAGLPADTFWAEGHDGQSMAIVPSQKLVVVRMGLTPSDLHYGPEAMVRAVLEAVH